MKDANLLVTKYLPAAAATNYSDSLDLEISAPGKSNVWRLGRLRADIPALPNHTDDTKTILLTLQDSADDVTFADTQPQIVVQVAGVASTGSTAKEVDMPLPPAVRRYVRVKQVVPAGAGDNTAGQVEYAWLNE